jgi:hypothetical protein
MEGFRLFGDFGASRAIIEARTAKGNGVIGFMD